MLNVEFLKPNSVFRRLAILLLFCVVFLSCTANNRPADTTYSIYGKLLDSATKQPILFTTVYLMAGKVVLAQSVTDIDGKYKLQISNSFGKELTIKIDDDDEYNEKNEKFILNHKSISLNLKLSHKPFKPYHVPTITEVDSILDSDFMADTVTINVIVFGDLFSRQLSRYVLAKGGKGFSLMKYSFPNNEDPVNDYTKPIAVAENDIKKLKTLLIKNAKPSTPNNQGEASVEVKSRGNFLSLSLNDKNSESVRQINVALGIEKEK